MKKTVLTLIVALTAILLLAATAFAVNEVESNDSKDSATSISVNEDVYGAVGHGQDVDWYRVTLPKDGYVTFQFSHEVISSTDTYWNMYLYQSDGVSHIYGENTRWSVYGNQDRTTAEMGLPAGTYYIRITPYSSYTYDTSTYKLRVNYTEAENWEKEVNGAAAAATPIEPNADYYGSTCGVDDTDWYIVSLPADGYVTFQFSHEVISSTDTYWNMYLYQSDGVSHIYGENTRWSVYGNQDRTTAEMGLPAGTYYIRIAPYSSYTYDTSTYKLRVNYTKAENWEKEVNGTTPTATAIEPNADYYGSTCGVDDTDWYTVSLPADGYVTFQFSHEVISSTDTYWNMYLYQSDGVSHIYGENTRWPVYGNQDRTTAEMGLPAGTYYIRIAPYSSYTYDTSTYKLRVNYTEAENWEKEVNNTASTANAIDTNADYYGSTCGVDDTDWFSFNIKAAADTSVSFQHASNGNNDTYWYMTIYTSDGVTKQADTVQVTGDQLETSVDLGRLSAGNYFLKISPYSSNTYNTTTYVLRIDEKHDHVYGDWTITQEPSCTAGGVRERACSICGQSISENIGATGHTYGEWKVDKQPTCSLEGVRSCSCITCGDTQTESIELLPHTYGEPEHVSGSILHSPIVYHETCLDCGYVQTIEDNEYWWVLPLVIFACISFAAVIAGFIVYKNRKKIFKTSFVCPYCFETQRMSEIEFRCSNTLCKDVPDLPMTKYENGDASMPLVGKPTFKPKEVVRGRQFIPRATTCPECHRTTHKVICPSCHNILPESTLLGEDMIISIVGSRDTGKSHFVGVIINELIERVAPAFGGSFEGFDDTMERYEQSFGKKLYVDLQKLDLTQSSLQNANNGAYRPLIFSLKLQVKTGGKETVNRYTLVFFDTAGEDLDDADTMSTVNKYICKSAGIIFLLDPMKIPSVAAQLDEDVIKRASSVSWQRAGRSDNILIRVSNLIRNDRSLKSSDKIDVPVAVVFSKFDAIEPIVPRGCAILANSPHCREKAFVLSDWHNVNSEVQGLLRTWGAESFLSQLEVNYTDYSCFAVSSLGLNNNPTSDMKINRPRPHRIEDPLLWILMKLKVIGSKK